jgi:hypothetical protein
VEIIFFGTLHVCQVMITCGDQLLWKLNSSCLPGNDQLCRPTALELFMPAR